jgi:hypothetical protein
MSPRSCKHSVVPDILVPEGVLCLLTATQSLTGELEADLQFATFETYKLYRGQQLGDSQLLRDAYKTVGFFKVTPATTTAARCMECFFSVVPLSSNKSRSARPNDVFCVARNTVVPRRRRQGTIRVVDSESVEPLLDLDKLFRPRPVVVRRAQQTCNSVFVPRCFTVLPPCVHTVFPGPRVHFASPRPHAAGPERQSRPLCRCETGTELEGRLGASHPGGAESQVLHCIRVQRHVPGRVHAHGQRLCVRRVSLLAAMAARPFFLLPTPSRMRYVQHVILRPRLRCVVLGACAMCVRRVPRVHTHQVEVWDYDIFSANDLIGITTIDLEDRWFDEKWHSYGKDKVAAAFSVYCVLKRRFRVILVVVVLLVRRLPRGSDPSHWKRDRCGHQSRMRHR